MPFNPLKPFNQLPDLPPSLGLETHAILKKTISASRALEQLNGALISLPNPLLFIDAIHLQESRASSEIENIITTQDEIFRSSIAQEEKRSYATKEVLHYKKALWHGIEAIKQRPFLSTNLFIEIASIIQNRPVSIRNIPGTQLYNPVTGKVVYTPPAGEPLIRKKLAALEKFLNESDELDPLIKLALLHYQFEAIHPFFDGNGRTGRIINILYLKLSGLIEHPVLFLSDYILRNRNAYYQKLRAVTEKEDWPEWILFMLDMIETTATKGKTRILVIQQTMDRMSEQIKLDFPKWHSRELMETLFRLPYIKRSHLIEAGLGNLKTVGNYLNQFEATGYLKASFFGKEKFYLNEKLMEALNFER